MVEKKRCMSAVDGGSVDGVAGVLTLHRLLMYYPEACTLRECYVPEAAHKWAILSLWLCETMPGRLLYA